MVSCRCVAYTARSLLQEQHAQSCHGEETSSILLASDHSKLPSHMLPLRKHFTPALQTLRVHMFCHYTALSVAKIFAHLSLKSHNLLPIKTDMSTQHIHSNQTGRCLQRLQPFTLHQAPQRRPTPMKLH